MEDLAHQVDQVVHVHVQDLVDAEVQQEVVHEELVPNQNQSHAVAPSPSMYFDNYFFIVLERSKQNDIHFKCFHHINYSVIISYNTRRF